MFVDNSMYIKDIILSPGNFHRRPTVYQEFVYHYLINIKVVTQTETKNNAKKVMLNKSNHVVVKDVLIHK